MSIVLERYTLLHLVVITIMSVLVPSIALYTTHRGKLLPASPHKKDAKPIEKCRGTSTPPDFPVFYRCKLFFGGTHKNSMSNMADGYDNHFPKAGRILTNYIEENYALSDILGVFCIHHFPTNEGKSRSNRCHATRATFFCTHEILPLLFSLTLTFFPYLFLF